MTLDITTGHIHLFCNLSYNFSPLCYSLWLDLQLALAEANSQQQSHASAEAEAQRSISVLSSICERIHIIMGTIQRFFGNVRKEKGKILKVVYAVSCNFEHFEERGSQ